VVQETEGSRRTVRGESRLLRRRIRDSWRKKGGARIGGSWGKKSSMAAPYWTERTEEEKGKLTERKVLFLGKKGGRGCLGSAGKREEKKRDETAGGGFLIKASLNWSRRGGKKCSSGFFVSREKKVIMFILYLAGDSLWGDNRDLKEGDCNVFWGGNRAGEGGVRIVNFMNRRFL